MGAGRANLSIVFLCSVLEILRDRLFILQKTSTGREPLSTAPSSVWQTLRCHTLTIPLLSTCQGVYLGEFGLSLYSNSGMPGDPHGQAFSEVQNLHYESLLIFILRPAAQSSELSMIQGRENE